MYLVDTIVVSELRRRAQADRGVVAWFNETPEELMAISVVTVAELEAGVRRVERRDSEQGKLMRRWVEGVLAAFAARTEPISADIARLCGGLHSPDPRPASDAWIAATALARGWSVVTRNVRDFAPMGLGRSILGVREASALVLVARNEKGWNGRIEPKLTERRCRSFPSKIARPPISLNSSTSGSKAGPGSIPGSTSSGSGAGSSIT